jgi:hypothetical protein
MTLSKRIYLCQSGLLFHVEDLHLFQFPFTSKNKKKKTIITVSFLMRPVCENLTKHVFVHPPTVQTWLPQWVMKTHEDKINIMEQSITDGLVKKFPVFFETRRFISVHNSLPLDPILSKMDSLHTPTLHSFKINFFNSMLPSTSRSPNLALPSKV